MRLLLHGQEVESIFDLLGYDENGLTHALGLVLSENEELLRILANRISDGKYKCDYYEVRLQEYSLKDRGFTDIELSIDKSLFTIVEAKIGWSLPSQEQLDKYSLRFGEYKPYRTLLTVISECRTEYAERELRKLDLKTNITYLPWKEILSCIERAYVNSTAYQKRMLKHLETYFRKVITMQDRNSNRVFCVALGSGKPEYSELSWIDIVEKKKRYFYPMAKGWPPDPPNYIAFRYYGKLQSIHHVDDYEIVTKMHEHLPVKEEEWDPTFLLKLGEPFKPEREVRNGNIYPNQHLWFDLDTAFTCKTIQEARDLTQKREEAV
jgi:hypothetical protein